MKALFLATLFALILTGASNFPARAQADGPIAITKGAVTLRVTELAWKSYAEFKPKSPSRFVPPPPQVLTLTFALEGAPPARRNAAAEGSVRVFAIAPDGRRIEAERISPTQRVWNGFPAIDPRWKSLKLQFDWFPPDFRDTDQLPPERLEWTEVPLPAAGAEPQPLAGGPRELVTPSGVRVRLDASLMRVKPNDPVATVRFYGRWLPPLDDPARCVEIGEARGANRDDAIAFDNGAPIEDRTHHINVSAGREVDKRDDTVGAFTISAPLKEGARSAKVVIEVRPVRPSRQNYKTPAGAVNFEATTPVPKPAVPNATVAPDAPIAQQPLGAGQLHLYALKLSPENGYKWSWRGQLLLTEPPAPKQGEDEIAWKPTSVSYQLPGGASSSTGLGTDNLWRSDGVALQKGQHAWQVVPQFSFKKDEVAPTKVTVETKWEQVRTSEFTWQFADLPAPAPGEVIEIEKTVSAGEFGTFTLRKIGYFTEAKPLSERVAKRAQRFQPPYGLAIVVEHTPAPGNKVYGWSDSPNSGTWNLAIDAAHDNGGRLLLRACDAPAATNAAGRDELQAADAPATKRLLTTLYLLPTSADARTFEFSLRATRRTILNKQTVTFADVALPAP